MDLGTLHFLAEFDQFSVFVGKDLCGIGETEPDLVSSGNQVLYVFSKCIEKLILAYSSACTGHGILLKLLNKGFIVFIKRNKCGSQIGTAGVNYNDLFSKEEWDSLFQYRWGSWQYCYRRKAPSPSR